MSQRTFFGPSSGPMPQIPNDGRRSVAVLTPSGDMCHTAYTNSLASMLVHTMATPDLQLSAVSVQHYGSSILPQGRHRLAMKALELGVTHTLWIDSDMEFPKDLLVRWLGRNEPIIGINAMMRRPPYLNCAQSEPGMPIEMDETRVGVQKVHRTGFGVLWIATEVFRRIPHPWFQTEYLNEQGAYRGEDYFFLERAREAGYDIYVDFDVSRKINHVGCFGFNPMMKAR